MQFRTNASQDKCQMRQIMVRANAGGIGACQEKYQSRQIPVRMCFLSLHAVPWPDGNPNIMWMERIIILLQHAGPITSWHHKNDIDSEGYHIILACQPKHQRAPQTHFVYKEGYNIILACQPKHQTAPQTLCGYREGHNIIIASSPGTRFHPACYEEEEDYNIVVAWHLKHQTGNLKPHVWPIEILKGIEAAPIYIKFVLTLQLALTANFQCLW